MNALPLEDEMILTVFLILLSALKAFSSQTLRQLLDSQHNPS